MTIEGKIKELAAEGWPSFGFVLEDWNGVDRSIEKVNLPAIVCFLVESGSMEFKNGRCRDKENVILAFVDKVPKDADGEDNVEVYNNMKDVLKAFVSKISKSGFFEPIEQEIKYNTLYEALSSNVSGIWCSVELKETMGTCI